MSVYKQILQSLFTETLRVADTSACIQPSVVYLYFYYKYLLLIIFILLINVILLTLLTCFVYFARKRVFT
jgi:hypothetical protein